MNGFAVYWFMGCLIVGSSIGLHEKRCPNDPYAKSYDILAAVAAWPAGLTWAITNSRLPECKVPLRTAPVDSGKP